jgi:hypothetical protein
MKAIAWVDGITKQIWTFQVVVFWIVTTTPRNSEMLHRFWKTSQTSHCCYYTLWTIADWVQKLLNAKSPIRLRPTSRHHQLRSSTVSVEHIKRLLHNFTLCNEYGRCYWWWKTNIAILRHNISWLLFYLLKRVRYIRSIVQLTCSINVLSLHAWTESLHEDSLTKNITNLCFKTSFSHELPTSNGLYSNVTRQVVSGGEPCGSSNGALRHGWVSYELNFTVN